jgi:CarD family transcriptional regulator
MKKGDFVVYPGHGVGQITHIDTKEILGRLHKFFTVEILNSGMKILVPAVNYETVGLRPVVTRDVAETALNILTSEPILNHSSWNVRYREYMERIKTGNILDIAEVLRDLNALKVEKELSFGERKMLDTARNLLDTELKIVLGDEYAIDLLVI